jgi:uncharacterized protein YjiS (DUF1127 family)
MTNFTRESDELNLPDGFETEALVAAARRDRDRMLAGVLVSLGRAVAKLWLKAVANPFRNWQARERTYRELALLNEHELRDIGLTPGMIPLVASGKINAANENRRSTKAA